LTHVATEIITLLCTPACHKHNEMFIDFVHLGLSGVINCFLFVVVFRAWSLYLTSNVRYYRPYFLKMALPLLSAKGRYMFEIKLFVTNYSFTFVPNSAQNCVLRE